MALEGEAEEWMVALWKNDPRNFNRFLAALRKHFEDFLTDRKAKTRIKFIRQGR